MAADFDQVLKWLGGTAAHRGARWAERVARALASKTEPWPTWPAPESPRVALIARRLVADLTSDPHELEVLARHCVEAAERRYNELVPS